MPRRRGRPRTPPHPRQRGIRFEPPGEDPYTPPAPGGPAPPPAPGPPVPAPDWLGIPGLPPDVQARIDAIFRDGAPNAAERALAYVRSTDWYRAEYRGIGAGVAKGIFGGEADYRAWRNNVQGFYRQYYGRDATGDELESFANQGFSAQTIGQIGAGKAYIDANRADIQYLGGAFAEGQFSEAELQSFGEQQVGRGSALGSSIESKVQSAMKKVARVFEGTLAQSPALEQSLGQQVQRKRRPDIGA